MENKLAEKYDKNKDYYVYLYRRNDNNTVFYVGKGKGRRAVNMYDHNDFCIKVANKYGYTIEIYKDNLSEEEAFRLEEEMVSYYINELNYGIAIGKKNRWFKTLSL